MRVKISALIFCAGVLVSCDRNSGDRPLLQIGEYHLTIPEYEVKRKSERYKWLSDHQLQDKLIEEGRIIAFGLDHKYDTISALTKHLEYAMRSYASQVDGFVWNKKVKPKLVLTENEVSQAYSKRAYEHNFEVIHISSTDVLDKYRKQGQSFKSAGDFNLLKKSVESDPNLSLSTIQARYPYNPIGIYTDKISTSKIGDVLGPIETLDGYYIVRVAGKKISVQDDYVKEKRVIQQELLSGLTQKYIWQSQLKIFNKAKVRMNDAAIDELASKFVEKEKKWPGLYSKLVLMDYIFEGKRTSYYAADFFEFANNQPVFFGFLSKPADIKKMLLSNVIDKVLYAEAQKMNMENDEEYIRFQKNYRETVFIEYYKRQHVYPMLSIHPAEIKAYYHKHRNELKGFKSARMVIYKFSDIQKAFEARVQVTNSRENSALSRNISNSRPGNLPNATVVDLSPGNILSEPTRVVASAIKLNPGQVSMPIESNGEYLIISLISKKGTATLPYKFVKEDIGKLLQTQKEAKINGQKANELKIKYPLLKNRITEYLADKSPKKVFLYSLANFPLQ